MKKFLLSLLLSILFVMPSFATLQLEDLSEPKEQFYRLGTTDTPEKKFDFEIQPTIQPVVKKEVVVSDTQNVTYADLSIKKMSLEISKSFHFGFNPAFFASASILFCSRHSL